MNETLVILGLEIGIIFAIQFHFLHCFIQKFRIFDFPSLIGESKVVINGWMIPFVFNVIKEGSCHVIIFEFDKIPCKVVVKSDVIGINFETGLIEFDGFIVVFVAFKEELACGQNL